MTEDERVGWHHQFDGHASEQALGDGEGQESLACCSPWGRRISVFHYFTLNLLFMNIHFGSVHIIIR